MFCFSVCFCCLWFLLSWFLGLLQCLISSVYLSCIEGKRFLSFLFCLNLDLIDDLHSTIKSTFIYCSPKLIEEYGEIYFRAWRAATNQYLIKIEKNCLQDLMDRAVHAQRAGGKKSLAFALKKILDVFHEKKSERGVDEALVRLYQPILWRALKAPNPLVRANGAALFCGAFPLQNPANTRAENDEFLQQQFEIFTSLLTDTYPVVRVTGVEGFLRAACVYWELIPKTTLSTLLSKIIGTLACDVTSSSVRASVFKGLNYLLSNPLSQPLLKQLLPKMSDMIHDPSDQVRGAFIDLLVTITTIRNIKFWEVVPIEHLLARLEIDSAGNNKKLVGLLHKSYFPQQKSDAVRISRCIQMTREHPAASRVFFQYLSKFAPESDLGKFVVIVFDTLVDYFEDEDPMLDQTDDAGIVRDDVHKLLEISAIVLGSISHLLVDADNKAFCKRLLGSAASIFQMVEQNFENDARVLAAVRQIQIYIPATKHRAKTILSQLQQLGDDAPPCEYQPLVDCVCAWGNADQILTITHDWLTEAWHAPHVESEKKKAKGKAVSSKTTTATTTKEKPRLALGCLDIVITAIAKKETKCALTKMKAIVTLLETTRQIIQSRIESTTTNAQQLINERFPEKDLRQGFELYLRATICLKLLGGAETTTQLTSECEDLATWAKNTLVGLSSNTDGEAVSQSKRRSNRKRKTTDKSDDADLFNVHVYLSSVLTLMVEVLKLGCHSRDMARIIRDLALAVLQGSINPTYLKWAGTAIRELLSLRCDEEDQTAVDVYAREIQVAWLRAASTTQKHLVATLPVMIIVAKCLQQRRMLSCMLVDMANLCISLFRDENIEAIEFFATYASKTTPTLQAFLRGLPQHRDSAPDTMAVVKITYETFQDTNNKDLDNIIISFIESFKESLSVALPPQATNSTKLEDIQEQDQENDEEDEGNKEGNTKGDEEQVEQETNAVAVQPSVNEILPTEEESPPKLAQAAPSKPESASAKRARALKISSVSVQITEEKMKLELLVEEEKYPEAAVVKALIDELQAKKLALSQSIAPAAVAIATPTTTILTPTTTTSTPTLTPTSTLTPIQTVTPTPAPTPAPVSIPTSKSKARAKPATNSTPIVVPEVVDSEDETEDKTPMVFEDMDELLDLLKAKTA